MYTANLYLVFERKDYQLGIRILESKTITEDNINLAKTRATQLCKKNERMSEWVASDPKSKWSKLIEEEGKRFYRRKFINSPNDAEGNDAEENIHHAFVDLVIQ